MRILHVDPQPLHDVVHQSARSGGGVEVRSLHILHARADGLPHDIDALVITSDLQGIAPTRARDGATDLLGVAVAEAVSALVDDGVGGVNEGGVVGVFLAGDLYSSPAANKRGADGDCTPVWQAFSDRFRWVIGVQGNHDFYSSDLHPILERNASLLDGSVEERGGVTVGGVGLIAGLKMKPNRRDEAEQVRRIRAVTAQRPDVLLLHEGPPGCDGQRGKAWVQDAFDDGFSGLVVCGHTHWNEPIADIAGGRVQVLNVDTRCVIVTRDDASRAG